MNGIRAGIGGRRLDRVRELIATVIDADRSGHSAAYRGNDGVLVYGNARICKTALEIG